MYAHMYAYMQSLQMCHICIHTYMYTYAYIIHAEFTNNGICFYVSTYIQTWAKAHKHAG